MSRTTTLVAVSIASLLAGFFAHTAWDHFENDGEPKTETYSNHDEELHLGMKGLVNPLLDCGPGSVSSLKEAQIREAVEKYVEKAKSQDIVGSISVYYRDLNNGPTFGLDASELFTPASLLKVPIMIAYLKKAETEPGLLKKTFVYDPKRFTPGNVTQNIETPEALVPGRAYTIEDLMTRMITTSDNIAASMLAEQPDVNIEGTLKEMGIPLVVANGQVWLRVVSYASLFRILYNATYLDPQHSSIALDLLSKSNFKKGLLAGLPADMVVAHKFGERGFNDDYQLHDCGIVYLPKTPYLLCIMTRGKSFAKLSESIRSVSAIVYQTTLQQ